MLVSEGCTAPITALCFLYDDIQRAEQPTLVIAAEATRLKVSLLSSTRTRTFHVASTDRIHRIVAFDKHRQDGQWTLLIVGAKEASIIKLELDRLASPDALSSMRLKVVNTMSFNDWVHDGAFVQTSKLAFVTAHNTLLVYDQHERAEPPKLVQTIDAPLRPLLWGARFSQSHYEDVSEVRVSSGSMLGDVLLWRPLKPNAEPDSFGSVMRLKGHQGSIYSVVYSPNCLHAASVSDDRTVRIWDARDKTLETDALAPQDNVKERTDLIQMWGHDGRVWRVEWIDDRTLVSAAEDGSCIVWSIDVQLNTSQQLHRFSGGHDGRSIWSLATSSHLVVTGGADGAVRSWNVQHGSDEQHTLSEGFVKLALPDKTRLKALTVRARSSGEHVAVFQSADGSIVLVHDVTKSCSTEVLLQSPILETAVILSISSSFKHVYIWTNRGQAFKLSLDGKSKPFVTHVATGISVTKVLVDDEARTALVFDKQRSKISLLGLHQDSVFELMSQADLAQSPLSAKQQYVTAFASVPLRGDLVIVGNASGDVMLVQLVAMATQKAKKKTMDDEGEQIDEAKSALLGVWPVSKEGLTDVKVVKRSSSEQGTETTIEVETVGLDGFIRSDSVEQTYLGAVGTKAILFDKQGNKLHSFVSPGKQVSNQLVKDNSQTVYYRLVTGRLHRQIVPHAGFESYRPVIVPGLHGREIRAVDMIRFRRINAHDVTLIASGAENSLVHISHLTSDGSFRVLFSAITPAATVKSVQWSRSTGDHSSKNGITERDNVRYLFASGGGENIHAWRAELSCNGHEVPKVNVRNAGIHGSLTDDPASKRAMDMCVVNVDHLHQRFIVALAFSDGTVKAWLFDAANHTFTLISKSIKSGPCLLTLRHVAASMKNDDGSIVQRHLFVTGSSNGRITYFDAAPTFAACEDIKPTCQLELKPNLTDQIHQSGINGLDVLVEQRQDTALMSVVSSGDDNAIHLQRISWRQSSELETIQKITKSSAHASTIQGLAFVSRNVVVSSSVDQRVNVYDVTSDQLVIRHGSLSSVADCSAMCVVGDEDEDEDKFKVAVAGMGLQVLSASL
ncbi:WD repeat-containing protein 6 [Microbotryomycetes sp. JL221]|nr:WD repeat-containing protein 6 [Microbotryomycetes sp. JL221]